MILTIKPNYNKTQGTDLPMFSRSGKSTTTQHPAFNQQVNTYDKKIQLNDDLDDEDEISFDLNDPKKPNI